MTRKYSSTSVQTTLAADINNSVTSMTVATGSAITLLGGVVLAAGNVDQFTVVIDPDTINEEVIFVTAVASDTLTVVRGRAGTSPVSHTAGATVKHVLTSDDLDFYTAGVATANGAIPKTILTTKGDVIVAQSSATLARLPVGPNGNILTADSSATLGVTWSPASAVTLDISFTNVTGTTYNLASGDVNKLVRFDNAATTTVTVPANVFSAGNQVHVQQIGAGQVQMVEGSGVTITSNAGTGPDLRAQFSAATVICTSSNNFTVIGDIS
jgi:hypothetical protein